MKRGLLMGFGLLLGVALVWLALALLVVVPPECGEPAACGDEYLYPAALPALASLLGLPALVFLLGKHQPAGRVAAVLILAAALLAGITWQLAA